MNQMRNDGCQRREGTVGWREEMLGGRTRSTDINGKAYRSSASLGQEKSVFFG